MVDLPLVIFFALIGGVVSLIGGVTLLAKKEWSDGLAKYATPFAAGALLSAAFVDLLGEAGHEGDIEKALLGALAGILVFFILEQLIHWFHHHKYGSLENAHDKDAKIPLIVIGDTLHNFIDGIAIAGAFLVSPATGITVTLAVALHEIPQEIGDFGLLLSKGLRRSKVLLVNFLSALATVAAAVIFFIIGQNFAMPLDVVLGLAAGFFIYIAVSDIIPDIHANQDRKLASIQSILLVFGVIIVTLATKSLHGFIE